MLNDDILNGLISRSGLDIKIKTEHDAYNVKRYSLSLDDKFLCASYNEYVLQGFVEGIIFMKGYKDGN